MTSEIRVNKLTNRVGLGTVEYTNTGIVVSGISTSDNFKTGTSNLHSTGLNVQDLDVDGHTNLDNVSIAGVSTFAGDISIADKIIHTGDTDTAIRFSAADTVSIETAGNEQVKFNHTTGTVLYNHIVPNNDSTKDIGLTGTRFRNAYVDTYYGDGSNLTGISGVSLSGSTNNTVATVSGANALVGESNLTFTGSILTITNSSGASELTLVTPNNTDGGVYFNDGSNTGALSYQHSDDSMRFRVNSTEKLRITSTGKVLVNTTTASSVGNSTYSMFEVSGNTSGATGPGHLSLKRGTASASLSDGDTLSRLIFSSLDGGDFAYIQASVDGSPSGSDFPASLRFHTCADGASSSTERLRIGSAGEVSLRRGGISATPSLEIYGSGNASDGEADNLRFHNWGDSNGDYWDVGVNHGLDGSGNNMKPSNTLKAAAIRLNAKNGAVTLITSPASTSTQYEGLTQNQSGQVTMPNQPMCSFTVANTSAGNYMTHHDMRTNNGTHFNTSNNRFVCPVAGFYYASIMVMSSNNNQTMDMELHKNGSNATNILVPYQAATGGQYNQVSGTCIIQCAANDYLQFKLNSGSVYQGRHSNISFALLG